MLLPRQCSVLWLNWKSRKRISTSRKLIWLVLLSFGICCAAWMAIYPTRNSRMLQNRHKRSPHSSLSSKTDSLTVQEILDFPKDYHAKGVLSLPYGDIVEPFESWYSDEHKMSRIDYYGGMDRTYQRELLGKHGFACKVVPEFSETTQKTFRGCLHRQGTKRFPVKAQSIVPTAHYFKYSGDVMLRGRRAAKWEHRFTIYNKVNTYILYTTKKKPVKPLRYEMMGYDTLLSSYYDHYVLDYELFEPWKFDYSTFQIPTDLDCFDFTQKKFEHIVGELNPMLEFMPHTDNGAPYTFSHDPLRVDHSSTLEAPELGNSSYESLSYPSEGLDASMEDHVDPTEDRYELSRNYYDLSSPGNQPTVAKVSSPSYYTSNSLDNTLGTWNYPKDSTKMNYWNSNSDYNLREQPASIHKNWKSQENSNMPVVRDPPKKKGFPKSPFHRKTKVKRKRTKKIHARLNRGKTLYSWPSLKETKQNVDTKKHHKSKFHSSKNKKKIRRKKQDRSFKNGDSSKSSAKSPSVDAILRTNYERIVNVLFESFKLEHKKVYSSDHEHETRKDIYRHNLRFIMSRNRMHLGYKLRPNHLIDLTDNEIQKQKGLLNDDNDVFNGGSPFKSSSDHVPESLDWRKKGAVNSVRSQGICGSCYAYAVTGALEGAYFLKHGHLPDFSEQEIIDCSWGFGNRGCKGGYPYRAMQWILKHGGLATDYSYGKYLAQEGYCHFRNVSVGVAVESYMNVSKGNVTELKQALAQYGPVSVLINTQPKSFKFYSSGVYYDPECGTNHDHAALAVGYGVENGMPYWLIKNSWSKAWGNAGYIKIAQRNNNCGVTSKAVVVKIKK